MLPSRSVALSPSNSHTRLSALAATLVSGDATAFRRERLGLLPYSRATVPVVLDPCLPKTPSRGTGPPQETYSSDSSARRLFAEIPRKHAAID
jgi:hypothetical protein